MANGLSSMTQRWNISTFKIWKKNALVAKVVLTEDLISTMIILTMRTRINNSIELMKDVAMLTLYFTKELIAFLIQISKTLILN